MFLQIKLWAPKADESLWRGEHMSWKYIRQRVYVNLLHHRQELRGKSLGYAERKQHKRTRKVEFDLNHLSGNMALHYVRLVLKDALEDSKQVIFEKLLAGVGTYEIMNPDIAVAGVGSETHDDLGDAVYNFNEYKASLV